MSTYLIQFGVYALAMVGIIFVCLIVAKKTLTNGKFAKDNSELCIENVLNLSQRKTLYVIKAGDEKFLISADTERTAFLAKLNNQEFAPIPPDVQSAPKQKAIDYSEVMSSLKTGKKPVLREMMRKLNEQKV